MAINNNYPAVTFTPAEVKFLCLHADVADDTASILTGIYCYHESGDESHPGSTWNLWRPVEENPKGGNDWSGAMVNDSAWKWAGPWMMADPVLTIHWVNTRILTTLNGLGHYKYPSMSRTAETIHLEEMQALEPDNPYWKARDAGMFMPADMRPAPSKWERWMPAATEFPGGLGGRVGMAPNVTTIRLQEALKRMGFFNTYTNVYYGPATKAAVEALQRLLIDTGWQPGPVDGVYGAKTASSWIRAERYRHLTRQQGDSLLLVRSY